MPTAALHSHYWAGSNGTPVALTSGPASYPIWQTSIIVGSGLGVLQALYERWQASQTPPKG